MQPIFFPSTSPTFMQSLQKTETFSHLNVGGKWERDQGRGQEEPECAGERAFGWVRGHIQARVRG